MENDPYNNCDLQPGRKVYRGSNYEDLPDPKANWELTLACTRRARYNRWFTIALFSAAFLLGGFAVYCWMVWPK